MTENMITVALIIGDPGHDDLQLNEGCLTAAAKTIEVHGAATHGRRAAGPAGGGEGRAGAGAGRGGGKAGRGGARPNPRGGSAPVSHGPASRGTGPDKTPARGRRGRENGRWRRAAVGGLARRDRQQ